MLSPRSDQKLLLSAAGTSPGGLKCRGISDYKRNLRSRSETTFYLQCALPDLIAMDAPSRPPEVVNYLSVTGNVVDVFDRAYVDDVD